MFDSASNSTFAGPSTRKKIVVGATLALAALGLQLLPQRHLSVPQTITHPIQVENDNSHASCRFDLLGGAMAQGGSSVDATALDVASDLGTNSLTVSADIVLAGHSSQYADAVAAVGEPAFSTVSDTSQVSSSATAAAVPEPNAAGVFLAVAAPLALLRRRSRK